VYTIEDQKYEGEFVDGKQEGIGRYTFENGEYYGHFSDNEFDGNGKLAISGEIYEGEFKNGKRHGKGILKRANGDKYEGKFVNDLMDDINGKYTWNDGKTFKGLFVKGTQVNI